VIVTEDRDRLGIATPSTFSEVRVLTGEAPSRRDRMLVSQREGHRSLHVESSTDFLGALWATFVRCAMTRWEAVVQIVRSFNEKDKPAHALGALALISLVWLICVALVVLGGASSVLNHFL
jgi:hypothetical protein